MTAAAILIPSLGGAGGRCAASSLTDVITVLADRLEADQIVSGDYAGTWGAEQSDFTGAILRGMVGAYDKTCDGRYVSTLEGAGQFIDTITGGGAYTMLADETVALIQLSRVLDESWRDPVVTFFNTVRSSQGGTAGFINSQNPEVGLATYDLAQYAVAAFWLNDQDKDLYRQAITDYLAWVTPENPWGVTALSAAVWGLAMTGPLDETLVDSRGTGSAYWSGVTLLQLPAMLLDHQVPAGEPFEGSFYWRLDKNADEPGSAVSGYTEDCIYAVGALLACRDRLGMDMDGAIAFAVPALINAIEPDGSVWAHTSKAGDQLSLLAGEMLGVLAALITPADLSLDGRVDNQDFALLVSNWRQSGCTGCGWCDGADINRDGAVDFVDLEIFAGDYWLAGIAP